jgi:hypothetical protein
VFARFPSLADLLLRRRLQEVHIWPGIDLAPYGVHVGAQRLDFGARRDLIFLPLPKLWDQRQVANCRRPLIEPRSLGSTVKAEF